MLEKAQNRKQILQQLLQKSQMFNAYFKSQVEENINSIMNITGKRNQVVQFGKCQINLPQKVKMSPQKFQGKVMILSKNKKQINRIKQKYQNLSKLKQNQALRLSLHTTQTQRNPQIQSTTVYIQQKKTSKLLLQNPSKLVSSQQQLLQQQLSKKQLSKKQFNKKQNFLSKYQIQNKQFPVVSQRQFFYQSSLNRNKSFKPQYVKNRSYSAKVRPQFDFFLKYQQTQLINRYKASLQQRVNLISTTQRTNQTQQRTNPTQQRINQIQELKREIKQNIQIKLENVSPSKKQQNVFAKNKKLSTTRINARTNFIANAQQIATHKYFQNQVQNTQTQQIYDSKPQQSFNHTPQLSKQFEVKNPAQNCQNYDFAQVQRSQQSQYPQKRGNSSFSVKKYQNGTINKNYQQKIEQQKKNKINFRRQLHKTYNRAFIPPPKITAKSYTIYQMKIQGNQQSGKILATINGKNAQEIASLTKIMTCIITLQIGQNFNLNLSNQIIEIGKFQTTINGTSAQLKQGQIYSVQQLLYGLMLPSGNDASLALGVWGGKVLVENDKKNQLQNTNNKQQKSSPYLDYDIKKLFKKDYITRFIQQMNKKATSLNMSKTHYANTHGLVNSQNKSSSIDLALLCQYVMNNQKFTKICGTKVYESTIKYKQVRKINNSQIVSQSVVENGQKKQCEKSILSHRYNDSTLSQHSQEKVNKEIVYKMRQIRWQNTHYLLQKKSSQYIGIKTGVTNVAGPCLASCVYNKQSQRKFIIVVLGCKNMLARFKQTQILKKWIYKQQNIPQIKVRKFKPRAMSLNQDKSQLGSQMQTDQNSQQDDINQDKYKQTED